MTDPASFTVGLLVLAAIVVWRLHRWPLADCPACHGKGARSRRAWFTRRRVHRPCRWCGGTGTWTRLGARGKR